jgi:6-pyruvoyltetrahydropterin/6-carboxytetrahydropterin synthase
MYELKITANFAAAHQLRGFKGGCENLHGHNWDVEVYITGKDLDKDGLLIDFREIKNRTAILMERLDHKFLNEVRPFVEINPSSENIAHYLFDSLSSEMNNESIKVSKVTVWESDNACASYFRE